MPTSKLRPVTELLEPKWKRKLDEEKVHEWRDHYINVDAITSCKSVYGTAGSANGSTSTEEVEPIHTTLKKRWGKVQGVVVPQDTLSNNTMLRAMEEEITKVNRWVEKQFREVCAKLDLIVPYVTEFRLLAVADKHILRDAVHQIYTVLMLLDNFCSLNCIIFHEAGKFLHPENNNYVLWLVKNAQDPPAFIKIMTEDLQPKMLQACKCYAEMEGMSVAAAQERLKSKLKPPMPLFDEGLRLGLYSGMVVPLLVGEAYLLSIPSTAHEDISLMYANFPIWRGTAVIILMMWLWGICVRVMDWLHINYAFILDLDPVNRLHWKQILAFAAFWTNLWLWSHTIFTLQVKFDMEVVPHWLLPTAFIPAAFFLFATSLFLCPFDCVFRPTRRWILGQIVEVVCSPFFAVTFASNFVGDYLTSAVKALIDINYSICYIMSGSWKTSNHAHCTGHGYVAFMLTLMPLTFRLLQCLRRYHDDPRRTHMLNFGKYAMSTVAVLVGLFNPQFASTRNWPMSRALYILLLFTSTLYSWAWDILVDWGLYVRKADGSWVSRPMFAEIRGLLTALDLIGRCAWAYTIVVDPPGERFGVAMLVFFTAMVEVLRRSMWSIVRFANEHHNNASQYRVVKEVPLSHLSTSPMSPADGRREGSRLGDFVRWLSDRPSTPTSGPPASALPASPLSGPTEPSTHLAPG
eukprot:GGOE01036973.1.p1 GENE.GGOE01036973.1~~GGOE01036973.1.p1  ORF type:complete len:708 (-),score=237.04 GGOE01036973.1:432-2498(-)